mgnify:CR=1 FL=1|tara:strand:+ start:17629 stop:18432 length:804 start_codon:yes stop_codon:yes gene_type:complete
MELTQAAQVLSSLGSESRLRIFQVLSESGQDGISAGELADRVAMPANTLSFHLKELVTANLARSQRAGRSIFYFIDPLGVSALLQFLSVDCCFGNPSACLPIQLASSLDANAAVPPTKVLFVCNHNAARSQMAEGLLRYYAGDRFTVYSAGFQPRSVDERAIQVMDEIGIDISKQFSKSLHDIMSLTTVEHVIVVCRSSEEHCPQLYPFAKQHSRWVVEPPTATKRESDEGILENFRRVRDVLEREVKSWLISINKADNHLPQSKIS